MAEPALIAELNQQIARRALKNRTGTVLAEPIETGLVRADNLFLYPVRQGIPALLVEEAIPLGGTLGTTR